MLKIIDDIGALRPTLFIGVPRIFDRLYSRITATVRAGVCPPACACLCMRVPRVCLCAGVTAAEGLRQPGAATALPCHKHSL